MGRTFSGQHKRSSQQGRDMPRTLRPLPVSVPDQLKSAIINGLSNKSLTPFSKLLAQLNASGTPVREYELDSALSVMEKNNRLVSFRPTNGESEWKRKT